jgi:carbonic anhydrase
MNRLLAIQKEEDVPKDFQGTPVGDLLQYHNLKIPHKICQDAELLIGMCIDNRKTLNIPENFAYIIRAGGANLQYSKFEVSYAVGVAGVQHIALIGHTQCGMVNLESKKEEFIEGLREYAGWDPKMAEEHFAKYSPMYEIGNEIDFILSETRRLSERYPKVKVAPLLYRVEDNLLYWIDKKE